MKHPFDGDSSSYGSWVRWSSNGNWYLPDSIYYSHMVSYSKETNAWYYWSYYEALKKDGYRSSKLAMLAAEGYEE